MTAFSARNQAPRRAPALTRRSGWSIQLMARRTSSAACRTWCVSIGLLVGGSPALGVIYHAPVDELFAACDAQGASCNGVPIRVSD
jgi:hypothetical protein